MATQPSSFVLRHPSDFVLRPFSNRRLTSPNCRRSRVRRVWATPGRSRRPLTQVPCRLSASSRVARSRHDDKACMHARHRLVAVVSGQVDRRALGECASGEIRLTPGSGEASRQHCASAGRPEYWVGDDVPGGRVSAVENSCRSTRPLRRASGQAERPCRHSRACARRQPTGLVSVGQPSLSSTIGARTSQCTLSGNSRSRDAGASACRGSPQRYQPCQRSSASTCARRRSTTSTA